MNGKVGCRGFGWAMLWAALAVATVRGDTGSMVPPSSYQPPDLKIYETKYYKIHTDLDADAVREATLRMDTMAEEYHRRTSGFSGIIDKKLPFYLFKKSSDYLNFGGLRGSAGVFEFATWGAGAEHRTGKLMATAGMENPDWTWHTVQHEGFHQFVHYVIQGEIPIWANEGLAEYFGESVFTGDGFVPGTLPPGRVEVIKKKMGKMKTLDAMLHLSHKEWNEELSGRNYDQVWSLVQFFVHGENGKYSSQFIAYIKSCSTGADNDKAWTDSFKVRPEVIQARWEKYWKELPPDAGVDNQARSTVATLTSFLARAALEKQTFPTAEAFLAAAKAGQLKCGPDEWLPPSLLARGLEEAGRMSDWVIETSSDGRPWLVLKTAGGKTYLGKFTISDHKVARVLVDVQQRSVAAKSAAAAKPAGASAAPATP